MFWKRTLLQTRRWIMKNLWLIENKLNEINKLMKKGTKDFIQIYDLGLLVKNTMELIIAELIDKIRKIVDEKDLEKLSTKERANLYYEWNSVISLVMELRFPEERTEALTQMCKLADPEDFDQWLEIAKKTNLYDYRRGDALTKIDDLLDTSATKQYTEVVRQHRRT